MGEREPVVDRHSVAWNSIKKEFERLRNDLTSHSKQEGLTVFEEKMLEGLNKMQGSDTIDTVRSSLEETMADCVRTVHDSNRLMRHKESAEDEILENIEGQIGFRFRGFLQDAKYIGLFEEGGYVGLHLWMKSKV